MEEIQKTVSNILRGITLALKRLYPPSRNSDSLNFYMPKTGQLQFSMKAPTYKEPADWSIDNPGFSYVENSGAIFIEAAPPVEPFDRDNPRLDWSENGKIIFALGSKDIGELLYAIACMPGRETHTVKLTHSRDDDSKNNNKTFTFAKLPPRDNIPQWKMSLNETKNGVKKREVAAYIQGPDFMRFKLMLESAFPHVMGYHRT